MFASWRVSAFCTVLVIALIQPFASAQANVNEGLETAFLYVDTNAGSDSNPGTQSQPLKTIGKAASMAMTNNSSGIGSRVIINPGTYREGISISQNYKSTALPITFEAATTGTVIVSGAVVWTGWAQSGDLYTHAWPYTWGDCPVELPPAPPQQEILLRQEMILINGTRLTQVLSQAAMQPGTFFVDEPTATVYVWPPSGVNMSDATVEVAALPSLFSDTDQSEIVLRGLTFQYANSCRGDAAVSFNGALNNVLIDTDNFLWNNSIGLVFFAPQDFTVQYSIANHNGQKGFGTFQVKNDLWQSDTANYNNWRGAQGAYYTWDGGGARLFLNHNGTFNNLTTLFNQTQGVHFDTDNANIVVNSQLSAYNLYGFLMELSEGPTTISNSYFCGNNALNQGNAGGFDIRDSTALTLRNNVIFGNQANQVTLNGILGGISVTNWETGQQYMLVNENLTMSGNQIATNSNTVNVFYDGYLGTTDWTAFVSTLNSNHNTWSGGTNAGAYTVPSPKLFSSTNLSGWQAMTLQDAHSTWGSVTQPSACNLQPDAPDFWLITSTFNPVSTSASGQALFNLITVSVGGMTGTVNLTLDGLSGLPGATASFSPAAIATSASSTLTVTAKPGTTPGTYPVTAIANNGNVTRTVTVSVVVPKTSVWLSTTSLTFAGQEEGTTSSPQNVTLTNTGSTALAISSISAGKNFGETNTCGSQLKAGASCTISVTFSPVYKGAISGKLTITDTDPTSPQTVRLSGTGLPK